MFKHCMVARGSIPLAEYPASDVDLHEKSMKFLSRLDPSSPHSVMEQSSLLFTAATESDGVSFVCCCDRSVETKSVGLFLSNLKSQWVQAYGVSTSSFSMNEKSGEFGVIMRELLEHFNEKSSKQRVIDDGYAPANLSIAPLRDEEDELDELSVAANPFPLQDSPPPELPDDFHGDQSLTALKLKVFWQRNKVPILIVAAIVVLVLLVLVISK